MIQLKIKEILNEASLKAGAFQMQHFNKNVEVIEKESLSNVLTFVDLECERIIIEIIEANFPDHNILSEECGFKNKKSDYIWVIDPLDGTSNYAAGLPWFGVLIAVLNNQQVVAGSAFLPVDNQFYYAEKGKGAFVNDYPLSINPKELSKSLFAFATDYCEDDAQLNRGVEIYRYIIQHSRNVRTTNSLFDLVNIANGKLGGCINLFTKIWDIAAPSLIIQEAGGKICNLNGSSLVLKIDEEHIKNNYPILSGNKLIVEHISKVIQHL